MSRTMIKSILSCSIGNALEWYEYTIYAYFANVISKLFFPMENSFVAMTLTFATFAIGLAARPLGGVIFGYIGDRYSRKQSMTITMFLMSIPTMCIGLLPTYEQSGFFAPAILIMLRICQGIALGGEFGSSCVYLYESVPQNKRGFFGATALTGVGMGLVLSSCTIFIIESILSEYTIYSYGWRIPFFVSVIGSIIALYMRRTLLETEDFIVAKNDNKLLRAPILEMFKNHKSTLFQMFCIFLTTQVSFFVVFIYGKNMMIDFLGFDARTAGKFSLFTVISYTVSTVFFGYLSDKFDKKSIIVAGVIGLFLSAYPFIAALKSGTPAVILIFCIILGALIGMTESTLNPLVAESFPTNIRATSVSFCWNVTSVAFGGVAPIISMWLIKNTGTVDVVAYYLMANCMISIIALTVMIFVPAISRVVSQAT